MSHLPILAKFYWFAVLCAGLASLGALDLMKVPGAKVDPFECGALIVLAALAGGKKVSLMRHKGDSDAVSMSLGFAITFAAMLRFGPAAALGVSAVSCLSGCLFPKRQPLYQIVFNVALSVLEAFLGSVVFLAINGMTLELSPSRSVAAVAGSTIAYFVANTGGVAVMIAIFSKGNPWKVWRETFLWTAPSYFAGASVSAIALVFFGNNTAVLFLFVAPVVYVIYQTYSATTARVEEKLQHAEEMRLNQVRLADLYLATIKSLALAIDAKDQYTHQHILRVQRYAVAIALQMGLEGDLLEAVNTGALLHDIGKLGVPEYVLLKPGKLTDHEFGLIKKHPEIGAAILDPVEFPWPVLPVVRHHHEKWDGSGYPDGLKGEDIPLTARIMAVADVYDALTSSRSYRGAWTHEKALKTIQEGAGSHFDPVVVEAFEIAIDPVILEMEREGCGPLTKSPEEPEASTEKSAMAAKDIARTSAEFWAMHEVAEALGSCENVIMAVRHLRNKLQDIYSGAFCQFQLIGDARNIYDLCPGFEEEEPTTVPDPALLETVLVTGTTYRGAMAEDSSKSWSSVILVQMNSGDQVLGTVGLYHPEPNYFIERDSQLLESMSLHLSGAILQYSAASFPIRRFPDAA